MQRSHPAVPVPVHMVGAVLQFGPVLRTLGDVAGLAEQLSLRGFFNQDVPRLGQASADGKDLGRRIDVIELQVLRGSAAHALATQQLDETITPSLLPGLVVAALICNSILTTFVYRSHSGNCSSTSSDSLSLGTASPLSIYSIVIYYLLINRTNTLSWRVGCEVPTWFVASRLAGRRAAHAVGGGRSYRPARAVGGPD